MEGIPFEENPRHDVIIKLGANQILKRKAQSQELGATVQERCIRKFLLDKSRVCCFDAFPAQPSHVRPVRTSLSSFLKNQTVKIEGTNEMKFQVEKVFNFFRIFIPSEERISFFFAAYLSM
jgi:hypothetical protein